MKYSPEELKLMAEEVLKDLEVKGKRSIDLMHTLSLVTGLSLNEVRKNIDSYAIDGTLKHVK